MSFFSPDPPVTYRPLSLSIIGWYYAAGGAFGLLVFWVPLIIPSTMEMWRTAGVAPVLMVAHGVVVSALQLPAGIAILKRRSWGRTLLFATIVGSVVAGAFLWPSLMVFGAATNLVVLCVLAFFLTRPAAKGYFDGTITELPDELRRVRRLQRGERTQSDVARVFGVILAIPGWWIFVTATTILVGGLVMGSRSGESLFRHGFGSFFLAAEGVGFAVLGLGTLLWGRRRWKGYLGWGLLAIGASVASVALLAVFPFDPTQFMPPDQMDTFDPEEFKAMLRKAGRFAAVAAAALLSLGGLMVSAQRRHDHAAAAFMDTDPAPSE